MTVVSAEGLPGLLMRVRFREGTEGIVLQKGSFSCPTTRTWTTSWRRRAGSTSHGYPPTLSET